MGERPIGVLAVGTTSFDGLAGQVSGEHPDQLLGIAGLVHQDVANRPGLAPGSVIGPPRLHGMREDLQLRKNITEKVRRHARPSIRPSRNTDLRTAEDSPHRRAQVAEIIAGASGISGYPVTEAADGSEQLTGDRS